MGLMWIAGVLVGWFVVSHFISGPINHITCAASGLALRGRANGPPLSAMTRIRRQY